jgi:sigma-B regulation protein RsbU (phosphoserine phosphatase)
MGFFTLSYSDAKGQHKVDLDRDTTSIGRSSDQDVVLGDPCVSRRHALIVKEGDTYKVLDQKSTHGTFLNGLRIEQAILQAEDLLQIGSLNGPRLRVHARRDDETQDALSQSAASDLLLSLSELRLPSGESRPATQEMEKLNWLLRAARQLNEGGGIEGILSAFLHVTLQLTSMERGFVFLQEKNQMKLALGLGSNDEPLQEDSTVSRRAISKAIESESKFLISDTLADVQATEWPSVMANNIRSICCIPLRKRSSTEPDQLLGLLYLDSRIGLKDLTKIDHQLLDTIAAEAAALLHNALLAEADYKARQAREELAIAAKIHSSLMSMRLPSLPYATIQAKSIPCLAIGGDFYDVVALDECVCIAITDVSGKGVSAAIVAATLQGIIHSQFLTGRSLPEIATVVNHFLCSRNVGKYATAVLLKLFPDGCVEYINCGHIQPLIVQGTRIRRLEEGNLVVGLIAAATYASTHCVLQPGDRLLLVTDGLTEAEDPAGNQFGDSGMDAVALYDNIDAILDHVTEFQGPHLAQDDCTLLSIQYAGLT